MACIIWLYPVEPTINNLILLKKLLTQKMKPLRMLLHLNLSARKESVEPSVLPMKKNGNIGIIDCVTFLVWKGPLMLMQLTVCPCNITDWKWIKMFVLLVSWPKRKRRVIPLVQEQNKNSVKCCTLTTMRKIYFLIRRTNTLSQLLKTTPRWIYLNSSRKRVMLAKCWSIWLQSFKDN